MVKLDSVSELIPEAADMKKKLLDLTNSISAFFPDINKRLQSIEFSIHDLRLRAQSKTIYLYPSLFQFRLSINNFWKTAS